DTFESTPHPRCSDELHRLRDLLRVLHAANATTQITKTGHGLRVIGGGRDRLREGVPQARVVPRAEGRAASDGDCRRRPRTSRDLSRASAQTARHPAQSFLNVSIAARRSRSVSSVILPCSTTSFSISGWSWSM